MDRNLGDYIKDFFYGISKFKWGLFDNKVYNGYFVDNDSGFFQKIFFDELLKLGFGRTRFQLIYPQQTAGLIKRIPITKEKVDEYHIRFYSDGIIDCELEVNRFHSLHWSGPRIHGSFLLEGILSSMSVSLDEKEKIRNLFGEKHFSELCRRV